MDKNATAIETYGWYKDYFDRMKIPYIEETESNIIWVVLPIDNKMQKIKMAVLCRDNYISVNAFVPYNADEEVRQNVADYIARASHSMVHGNFKLNLKNGEVFFKLTLNCEERSSLSDGLLGRTFTLPHMVLEKYGDGLLAVMFGLKSPEEAIDFAEYVDDEDEGCCCFDHDDD